MLNMNYYFIDVGVNSCSVTQSNYLVSLRSAILNRDITDLKIIREHILQSMKTKSFVSHDNEFKMVFVNKVGKMYVESMVEDEVTGDTIEPIAMDESFNAYLMKPGQAITISCQIRDFEVENRYIHYEQIKTPPKSRGPKRG